MDHSGPPLGIAGPNGSGKSTLLKCLGGLLSPTVGDIIWMEDARALSRQAIQQRMGYAAPYINLYDELSIFENLQFLSKVRHQSTADNNINHWIQKTGLHEVADQPFGKLSTGQQQRLRLASALFHQPDILLLDEPGSNLDEAGKKLIFTIVQDFEDGDKLLIIASNDRQELDLCGRVFSVEEQVFV